MTLSFFKNLLVSSTLLLGGVESTWADTNYNFVFSGGPVDTVNGVFTVNSGTITAILGNVYYMGTSYVITGLSNIYGIQNNWLGSPLYLNSQGVAFTTSNGGGAMNISYDSRTSSYLLNPFNLTGAAYGTLSISVLVSGPSTADTQASLNISAQRLRGIFNAAAISTNFANMNTYDCNLFDTKGMCISSGGRYTTVDNPNSSNTSAVVVIGYKATPNIRIGGFVDQNVSNNTPTGIKVSNKNPLMGVFAVWNQNADGLGLQVKVANAYQDKDVNITRDVIGTSEAGTGDTNLNIQSYVGELSYALTFKDKTLLRPYFALRQTTIKQDAYTETGVTAPLSYATLKDRSTTALVGLKLNHTLTPKTTLTASLGIEQDLEHSVDQYIATSSSIANLTSENFNDSIKRLRPVASAGAYYAVSKTQRISGDVYYQQLPFQSTGSTTVYFSYMIGL